MVSCESSVISGKSCRLRASVSSHQWGCEDHVCTQNPYFPIFLFGRFFLLQNCCGSIQKRQLSPGNREIYQHLEHDSADPAPIMLTIWTQVGNQLRGTQHAFAPDTGQGKRHQPQSGSTRPQNWAPPANTVAPDISELLRVSLSSVRALCFL